MLVYWMIWYCYCFSSGVKCTLSCVVQYSLYHNMYNRYHMTLYIGQQHPITVYRTGVWVCVVLVLNVIRCSCHYFLDRILFQHDFHHDSCDYHWDFMAINYFLNYTLGFLYLSSPVSANAQLPECFALGHFPWVLDWICFLWTPLCHVYIPY